MTATNLLTAFGKAIRTNRVLARLTQAQLAGILNAGSRSVSRWELGNALPCPELLRALYDWRPALAKLPLPYDCHKDPFVMVTADQLKASPKDEVKAVLDAGKMQVFDEESRAAVPSVQVRKPTDAFFAMVDAVPDAPSVLAVPASPLPYPVESLTPSIEIPKAPAQCPTCGSKNPKLHPAVQHEGEVSICKDPFHDPTQWRRQRAEKGVSDRLCTHCVHALVACSMEPCATCLAADDISHPNFQASTSSPAVCTCMEPIKAGDEHQAGCPCHRTVLLQSPHGKTDVLTSALKCTHECGCDPRTRLCLQCGRTVPDKPARCPTCHNTGRAICTDLFHVPHPPPTPMTYDDALQASAARVKELESELARSHQDLERAKYTLGTVERQTQDICDRMRVAKPALLDEDWINNVAILIRHWNETPHVGASKPDSFHKTSTLKSIVRFVDSLHSNAFTSVWQKNAVLNQLAAFIRALQTDGGSLQDALDVVEAAQINNPAHMP